MIQPHTKFEMSMFTTTTMQNVKIGAVWSG